MDKLKSIIEQHSRWQPLTDYVRRIEGYRDADFALCIENAKSLLESIAKEICTQRTQGYSNGDSTNKMLKLAFACMGYGDTETTQQIGRAIANIGQQMGNLRNEIGPTSHGKPLSELETRKDAINKVSSDFLLDSTELIACLLIQLFETEFPRKLEEIETIVYNDNEEFNDYLDELYGEFVMGANSYSASEILYGVDPEAYHTELNTYKVGSDEDIN